MITMTKAQGAGGRFGGPWERGVLLGQHGELNFARDLQVRFHLLIFQAQRFPTSGQFSVGPLNFFLRLFPLGDVPEQTL